MKGTFMNPNDELNKENITTEEQVQILDVLFDDDDTQVESENELYIENA